jgi:predicted component of type VI protein secretion system
MHLSHLRRAVQFLSALCFIFVAGVAALERLKPKFLALRPGTRIVLNGFAIPGWNPDERSRRRAIAAPGRRCAAGRGRRRKSALSGA